MKNYPEPDSKIWDIAEAVVLWSIAMLLMACVCFAVHFAGIILTEGL